MRITAILFDGTVLTQPYETPAGGKNNCNTPRTAVRMEIINVSQVKMLSKSMICCSIN